VTRWQSWYERSLGARPPAGAIPAIDDRAAGVQSSRVKWKGSMTDQATVDVAFDEADLAALRESIVAVLLEQCDSLTVHAFIDGKNQLDRSLWRQAASSAGWRLRCRRNSRLNMGVRALDVLHAELGRHMAPGPFIATLSRRMRWRWR